MKRDARGVRPERTVQRQVAFFVGRAVTAAQHAMDVMREKFDSVRGRPIYAKRIGTVEPVFGNHHLQAR